MTSVKYMPYHVRSLQRLIQVSDSPFQVVAKFDELLGLPIRVQDRTSRSKFQMLRLVMPSVFLLVGGAGLLKRVAPRRLVPSSLQLVSAITTIEGWVAEYIGSAYQLAVISVV